MRKLQIGKYRVIGELGSGGMADALLTLAQGPRESMTKLVVIKVLREGYVDDVEFRDMLLDEARLGAVLNHPNIVRTYEVDEADGQFFIAMEYLDGQPYTRLKRRADRDLPGELTLEHNALILRDVLEGLHHAHELTDLSGKRLDVVHRDVSPSNIFVTYGGQVKILDFGIAKAAGRSTETKTGIVKGKMKYMPPEQALGEQVDRRADIFSVGTLLWEAAVGHHMWKGTSDVMIIKRLVNGDIPFSPREVNPDCPEVIDEICRKALAMDPADRFADAAQFAAALNEYMDGAATRPRSRDIARLMTELFELERQTVKDSINRQLAKLRSEPELLEPAEMAPPESRASSRLKQLPIPTHPPLETQRSAVPSLPDEPRAPGFRPSVAVLIAGLAAILTAIVWIARRPDDEPTVSAAAPATLHASIRATPPGAEFQLDDGPWLKTPHRAELQRDGARHRLTFRAEGQQPRTLEVVFDDDLFIELALEEDALAASEPR